MITLGQHQRCRLFANDVHPGGKHYPRARSNRRCALYASLLRLPQLDIGQAVKQIHGHAITLTARRGK
jgi:hypothetical protein